MSSDYRRAVLYSSLDDPDWPDRLDTQKVCSFTMEIIRGLVMLHDTLRRGNGLLPQMSFRPFGPF